MDMRMKILNDGSGISEYFGRRRGCFNSNDKREFLSLPPTLNKLS